MWPKQASERIGSDELSVVHRLERGGVLSLVNYPIRLREDRLRAILAEVQRFTKTTMPGSSQPFTLDTLRTELDKRR